MKKKILLFTDWFAPAYKAGGPIRSCVNFTHAMSDTHKIYIITSNSDLDGGMLGVEKNKWIDFAEDVCVRYLDVKNKKRKSLQTLIKEVNPDIIYLNSMFSFHFTVLPLYILFIKKIKCKVIVAPRGMLHKGALQYKTIKKKCFLNTLNLLGVSKDLYFQATDEQERLDIIDTLKVDGSKVFTVSNFPETGTTSALPLLKAKNEVNLVFISRVAPKKNLAFLIKCLNDLNSNIALSVYGAIEDYYWEECLAIIETLPSNIRVVYNGSIKHSEVKQVLQNHHFFVLSTFGENFGHAIFEAFASGRPVIISDQTPWRDLYNKKIGWDLSLDDYGKWLKALRYASNMEQSEYDNWCRNAKEFAEEFLSQSSMKDKYLQLFS